MSGDEHYARLAGEQRKPKLLRDWTPKWDRLTAISATDSITRGRLETFAESKNISIAALEALDARLDARNGNTRLAFAGRNAADTVTAIKYRPLGGSSHDSVAEAPSTWVRAIIVGNRNSLEWFLGEGETDTARLFDLVGHDATIMCLPTGALAFRREWADLIPRAATVHLCHDADEQGDAGATKAAAIIGGKTVRVRPPVEGTDWCDWPGDREAFIELVRAARGSDTRKLEPMTCRELCQLPDPPGDQQLLGPLLIRGQRLILGGHTGEGKTTLALQIIRAVVEAETFLDWKGSGGRALILDAEQGLRSIKRRLREAGLADNTNVDYVRVPDGLSLNSDEGEAAALEALIGEGNYNLIAADPLYKLHTGDSNDEREAVDLMRRFDRWRELYDFALLLPTHCRKPVAGMKFGIHDIFGSSAYVRGAEVVLGIRRIRDGYSKLHFLKDRDGDLPIGAGWGLLFDQEGGYRRDPDDGKPSTKEQLRTLREHDPELTKKDAAKAIGVTERTISSHWTDTEPEAPPTLLDED